MTLSVLDLVGYTDDLFRALFWVAMAIDFFDKRL